MMLDGEGGGVMWTPTPFVKPPKTTVACDGASCTRQNYPQQARAITGGFSKGHTTPTEGHSNMGSEQRRLYSTTKALQYLTNKYGIERGAAWMRTKAVEHRLGHKIGGPDGDWVIDMDKLDRFIAGEPDDG